ncbi:transposase [Kiritimatiellota bacterium B12222]|nr:transposase [Kiritimatiellota bacterium B12222]
MAGLTKLYFGWQAYFKTPWSLGQLPETIKPLYTPDGITLLSGFTDHEKVRFIFEAPDSKNPQWLCSRLKGRLNHFIKQEATTFPGFTRSFLLESLGQNDRSIVSHYVQNQVEASDLVDPLYRKRMKAFRFHEEVDARTSTSHGGRYELVLHVILVIGNRHRIFSQEARKVFNALVDACEVLRCQPYDISMMPDHAHLMVSWPSEFSAEDVLEGIKRESGKGMRRTAYWQDGGYAGTVGPYKMSIAIEKNRCLGGW